MREVCEVGQNSNNSEFRVIRDDNRRVKAVLCSRIVSSQNDVLTEE
jgi:hypothetical protein